MAESDPVWVPWFFIATDGTRRLIGDGGFYGPPEDGFLMVGYEVDTAEWNKGYATEAVRALCGWAFE
ncbi:GNAT family N-acetyltransferase, partial [Acinetobacter baumannii]